MTIGNQRFEDRTVLLTLVERHMRAKRMSPSRFGVEAMGDPQFVFQLRLGREPRSKTTKRVIEYIARTSSGIAPGTSIDGAGHSADRPSD